MKIPVEQLKRSKEWADKISAGRQGKHYPKLKEAKTGHKHSEETKKKIGYKSAHRSKEVIAKISNSLKGEKNPRWRGGVTSANQKIRDSEESKLWRKAVWARDNYTCIWCGRKRSKTVIIQADHIKPFAYFPELRFAIDNGRTLCKECHRTTDTFGSKCKKLYENK
jgi:predicted restriction endonuclease